MPSVDALHAQGIPATGEAQPNPVRIFDTLLFSHARADALKAAIDLEIFTAIAEGWRTVEPLAERCGASERGIRTLCDFLVVNGFLTKSNDEYDSLPDTRLFLDARSPLYVGGVAQFMADRHNAQRSATILECVRVGHAATDLTDDVERWLKFAQAMVPMAALVAARMAEVLEVEHAGVIRVLDIAAGHGEFGLAIARRNPKAHIVGLDFEKVLAVARGRAEEAGFSDRYATLEGSAFELDLRGPYDLVLLPNFLHHFRPAKIERLLRRVAAAVKPGGRVATVEFVPNDDRVSPPLPAMFSLTMLTNADGDAYTFAELEGMLRRAGLSECRAYAAPPTPQTIVVSERA